MHPQILTESNKYNTFTMLRNKMCSINNLRIRHSVGVGVSNPITQLIKCSHDYPESLTLIVTLQIFNILKHESDRPLGSNDARYVEEQRTLSVTLKAMLTPERILLGYPGDRERLARKARQ